MKIDQVLDEYRRCDADRRLSLFLHYRELRDEFSRIEEVHPGDLFDIYAETNPTRSGIVRRVFDLLRSGFRARLALRGRWTMR